MWELAICCALLGDVNEATRPSEPANVCREVDDLARAYRIRVYDTFRLQRPVYDQWSAVGFEVLEYSRQIPAASPEQQRLAGWFREAETATRLSQEFPAIPELDWSSVARDASGPDVSAVETLETSSPQRDTGAANSGSSLPWGAAGRSIFGNPDGESTVGRDNSPTSVPAEDSDRS